MARTLLTWFLYGETVWCLWQIAFTGSLMWAALTGVLLVALYVVCDDNPESHRA